MGLPVLKYKVGDKVRIANNSRMRNLVGHIREIEAVFPLLVHGCPYRLQFCPNLFREDELELQVPPIRLDAPSVASIVRQSFMDAIAE